MLEQSKYFWVQTMMHFLQMNTHPNSRNPMKGFGEFRVYPSPHGFTSGIGILAIWHGWVYTDLGASSTLRTKLAAGTAYIILS